MSERKKALIMMAWRKHHKIYPVPSAVSFADPVSFTMDNDRMFFWFDLENESTGLVAEPKKV